MKRKHILCVSIPAYGHLIPLLELARKLAQYHQVTFAVSAKTAGDLERRELYNHTDDRNIVQLYAIKDGLVEDMEDPNDPTVFARIMPPIFQSIAKLIQHIPTKKSTDSSVKEISTPVDLIIADSFLGIEGTQAAVDRNIPLWIFLAGSVMLVPMALAFTETVVNGHQPKDDSKGFVGMPNEDGTFNQAVPPHVGKYILLPQKKVFPLAEGFIVNSLREYEQKYIDLYEAKAEMKGKMTFCVGPLLPESKPKTKDFGTEEKFRAWLDKKKPASVVYISFGSVATPNPRRLKEISRVVHQMDQPVMWSLKNSYHGHLSEELKAIAEVDFNGEGSTDKRVLLVSWAPQKLILAHQNVGVFVSHCGWNSTIEGLGEGKPIVGWPQFADQLMNGEFVEENGAGTVVRDAGLMSERFVSADEILDKIKVAREKTGGAAAVGKEIRQAWTKFKGGSSSQDFDKLLSIIEKC